MENTSLVDSVQDSNQDWKKIVSWSIRILISALFLVSAYAKIYHEPSAFFNITKFEYTQLYPMGFSPELAVIFSRGLIGIEFALGVLLLFPFNLTKVVIPATIIMLGVFCVHLSLEIFTGGNEGNCGCFGSLLPMTPLQAIIKNVLSIGLLLILLLKFSKELNEKKNFLAVSNIATLCVLGMFMFIPIQKKTSLSPTSNTVEVNDTSSTTNTDIDTSNVKTNTVQSNDPKANPEVKALEVKGPPKKKSGFAKIFPNIDEGKKILCFFAPTCEHCMATGKALTEMKNADPNFPEIQIIFMDEAPEEIPAFFKFAGAEYKSYVMDIVGFWNALGSGRDTPGVMYLWNGKTIKFYNGTEGKDKFNKSELKNLVKKETY